MTNIHDIARLSGYSVSTVSRVINHQKYVADNKRAKVEAIMQELDYVPNRVARDLSRGQTKTIGVVLPYANHPYFARIVDGIVGAGFAAGYKITLLPTNYDRTIERHYLEELRSKAYDALIFTSRSSSLETLENYRKYGQIVCCEDPGDDRELAAAYTDRMASYVTALKWAKQRGYETMGVILSRNNVISASTRVTKRAYQQVYGPLDDAHLFIGAATYEDGYRAGEYFAAQSPQVAAVFANGDDIGAGVYQYFIDHQLPPMPIIGQENLLTSRLLKFSTIDHHLESLGQSAFRLAMGKTRTHELIKSEFIER
ncbi:LacI family DNA-binding transcriptional regulator [Lactiplantibacillus pentosus]|uniref:LacI family DNA-binding transcriptional regulator n=1 Tax=Lactiplantibacillus pentosus TaxID=1589 RepID=A0AB37RJM1_LACPE|nr:LacI family DNA-binding transcriptional regulator [Lactiplantibacillus pentosus]RMW43558.1 LacI family DNA-binding transcriptional regulator [Lactiplantibacillus pentosus]RMW45901.1 LacI family DNA-binding transcriptional regulator [Lactiplantibacillus pentosus]RMW53956.1 LacI family DNA-binding transcriptional regulator [Lactiplantibacillus pentosus]RMW54880.1 LacI family DNA-binding transcriptional regulator [Lactiplantibacillus pentosus]